jgi:hypothetical protein
MLCVGTRYTQYFNKRYGRVGHVFQERFYSRRVHDEIDLLVVSRYVHLNPVAAHLRQCPEAYPWSSFRTYLDDEANPLQLVDRDVVLNLMASWPPAQRAPQYCAFVNLPFGYADEFSTGE